MTQPGQCWACAPSSGGSFLFKDTQEKTTNYRIYKLDKKYLPQPKFPTDLFLDFPAPRTCPSLPTLLGDSACPIPGGTFRLLERRASGQAGSCLLSLGRLPAARRGPGHREGPAAHLPLGEAGGAAVSLGLLVTTAPSSRQKALCECSQAPTPPSTADLLSKSQRHLQACQVRESLLPARVLETDLLTRPPSGFRCQAFSNMQRLPCRKHSGPGTHLSNSKTSLLIFKPSETVHMVAPLTYLHPTLQVRNRFQHLTNLPEGSHQKRQRQNSHTVLSRDTPSLRFLGNSKLLNQENKGKCLSSLNG